MMNKEKDFFERCIGIVAGLEVENEAQAIAKEVVLDEVENLQQRIEEAIELNKQIIKDTKSFYRPTADTIYSGDCLIDIAEQNIEILGG